MKHSEAITKVVEYCKRRNLPFDCTHDQDDNGQWVTIMGHTEYYAIIYPVTSLGGEDYAEITGG